MILSCPKCAARFSVDPGKLAPAGRTVGCSKCRHRWRVTAQGATVGEAAIVSTPIGSISAGSAAPVPPAGISAREFLARQSAGSSETTPTLSAGPRLDPGQAGAAQGETGRGETLQADADAVARSAAAAMPVQPALSPRQRQMLQAARKGRSRTRVLVLLLAVLVAIALLFAAMQRAPQIENVVQPVPAPVEPAPPAPAAGN